MKLPSDDADLCGIAELGEEVFAVFPREAECTHVGDVDSGSCIANGCEMRGVELTSISTHSAPSEFDEQPLRHGHAQKGCELARV